MPSWLIYPYSIPILLKFAPVIVVKSNPDDAPPTPHPPNVYPKRGGGVGNVMLPLYVQLFVPDTPVGAVHVLSALLPFHVIGLIRFAVHCAVHLESFVNAHVPDAGLPLLNAPDKLFVHDHPLNVYPFNVHSAPSFNVYALSNVTI